VTAGVVVVVVGVVPVLPVLPVLPDEELPVDEDDPLVVVVAPELDPDRGETDDEVPAVVLLDPGWSRETTIPIATVAPVATRTAPLVSRRRRDRAFALTSGVLCSPVFDMGWGTSPRLLGDAPIPPCTNRLRRKTR
jgi:hypothetical protein